MNPKMKSLQQSQQAKKSNFKEWARENLAHEELTLPSGLTVIVRDIDLEDLASVGAVPNGLIALFPELQGLSNEEAMQKVSKRDPKMLEELMDLSVRAALIEPRIGEKTDIENNMISLSDMRGKDKLAIFQWLTREAASLQSFREGEKEPDRAA